MEIDNKREVVERVSALVDVAEAVMQERFGGLGQEQVLSSPVFASMVGNLISSDPILYDLLEGDEDD